MGPSFQWHRTRRAGIALPLLLALLFRAAIPAGFMPMVDAGGRLTFELCPGTSAASFGPHVAASVHHHHPGAPGHDHPGNAGQDHTPCLFAASAGCAPMPALLDQRSASPQGVVARVEVAEVLFIASIVRAQTSRGPPLPALI